MENQFYSIILYVNSSSGGGVGQKILSCEIEKIVFQISLSKEQYNKNGRIVHLYIFDLKSKKQKAFLVTKELTEKHNNVIGIVCGGDGSIMWVVSQLHHYSIDTNKIAIGVLPLGTGNDFAQHLGWGKTKTQVVQNQFQSLKKLIKKWLVAKVQFFDVWDVQMKVFENGCFQKINKQSKSEKIYDFNSPSKILRKSFCNYFSFGIDGKIGYSFDKRRTTSRLGNLLVYGVMGICKTITKTKSLKNLVETMQIKQPEEDYIEQSPSLSKPKFSISRIQQQSSKEYQVEAYTASEREEQRKIVFETAQKNTVDKDELKLANDFMNLLVLNVNSFMGGVKNIWENAKNNELGNDKKLHLSPSSSDGRLQIMSFGSSFGMALQRLSKGNATKITQGQGPFHMTFRKYAEEEKHRTYLQIDGEFIRFTHPKSVTISRSKLGDFGKIKVLRRNLQTEKTFDI